VYAASLAGGQTGFLPTVGIAVPASGDFASIAGRAKARPGQALRVRDEP
jgi:hypothetical protein